MRILIVDTDTPSIREDISAWHEDDSDLYCKIGPTPFLKSCYRPYNILQALHDGWKLLGPPMKSDDEDYTEGYYWWLTKED